MDSPAGWHHFVPYGELHALALAVCIPLIALPALIGRLLSPPAERNLRRTLAGVAIAYWFAYVIWWNWSGLDWREGLPLQICDLNGLLAPFALLIGRRWMRATVYFWTAALTLQAFIQPALTAGPASLVFWAFWCAHTLIVACALYDLVVLRFRPDWQDFAIAVAISVLYVAIVFPINLWLGGDYGFVGNPAPDIAVPPFVLALGPWPQRAMVLIGLVILGFAIVLLPWLIADRRPQAAAAGADFAGLDEAEPISAQPRE
jgi:hypothetical integral membrane protein (TIGR02206 family)